jgi:aminopeptidase N
LTVFFQQWLYQPGWPEYQIAWRWNEASTKVELTVKQLQTAGLFDMPLEVVFQVEGRWERYKIRVSKASETFYISLSAQPSAIEIDPDGWLLQSSTMHHSN